MAFCFVVVILGILIKNYQWWRNAQKGIGRLLTWITIGVQDKKGERNPNPEIHCNSHEHWESYDSIQRPIVLLH